MRRYDIAASENLGRRAKAARALGGYSSASDLAEAVGRDGFGVGTIRAIERGRRGLSFHDAEVIEAACGVDRGFLDDGPGRAADDLAARRVRAARAIAGLNSVEDLAEVLDTPGLGAGTLRSIERGARAARTDELTTIANACGVPLSFFSPAFFETASDDPDQRRLEAKVDALMRHLGMDPEAFA